MSKPRPHNFYHEKEVAEYLATKTNMTAQQIMQMLGGDWEFMGDNQLQTYKISEWMDGRDELPDPWKTLFEEFGDEVSICFSGVMWY